MKVIKMEDGREFLEVCRTIIREENKDSFLQKLGCKITDVPEPIDGVYILEFNATTQHSELMGVTPIGSSKAYWLDNEEFEEVFFKFSKKENEISEDDIRERLKLILKNDELVIKKLVDLLMCRFGEGWND